MGSNTRKDFPLMIGGGSMSSVDWDAYSVGGDPPTAWAPLYDEITLGERLTGNAVLQEIATGSLFVNERLSSVRQVNPSLAALTEMAEAEVSLGERLSAIASLFKH